MGKGGQQPKLTPQVIKDISDALSQGSKKIIAARYARVSESSLSHWLQAGREERGRIERGEPPNPQFAPMLRLLQECEQAEGEAGLRWVSVIKDAAKTDPAWAKYMLEHVFGTEWQIALKTQAETVNVDLNALTPAQLDRFIAGEDIASVLRNPDSSK